MSKFAIVGCEASGKSVFMSALCDCFRDSLVPENAAANRFARFATRQLRALRQWPPATPPEKAVPLDFTLRENGQALVHLGLLEFGGETFRAAFRDDESEPAHKRAVNDLLAFLGDADFILVLVSLQELFRDPGETLLEAFERDTESIWVTRGLLEFVRDHTPDAHVVIGLTQADRFARELQAGGSPAQILATRWPSIRAVAPNVPVLAIASVSGTDGENRPCEGFTTDGILPVLREFARRQFGSSSDLLDALSTLRQSLDAALSDPNAAPGRLAEISRLVKRHGATIENLKAIEALTREMALRSVVASAEEAQNDYLRKLKDLRTQAPKPKARCAKRKNGNTNSMHRVLLLLLLLASTLFFADTYWPKKIEHQIAIRPAKPLSADVSCRLLAPTNETAVVESCVTAHSNTAVEAKAVVNSNAVVVANGSKNEPVSPQLVADPGSAEIPYRTWHDHRGKAIEARWIATSDDRQSITLETRTGRRIRAVLYKFSEADRAFVQDKLMSVSPPREDALPTP